MVGDPVGGLSTLSRSDILRNVLGLAAAAGSFRGGAAVAQIGYPALPPLTGRYDAIGCRYTRVNGARAKIFYPASGPSSTEAPYCTDGRATSDGMAGLVGFRQLGLSFLLGHLADGRSGCWLEAPAQRAAGALPLLCYSHGFGGNMDMATYLMREIASHGVVVAALEHTDGTASNTVLEDGSERPFSPNLLSQAAQLRRRADELLAAATSGALGEGLPSIDATRVYLGGHSYGGPSALLASALAPASGAAIAGLLLHDPALGMNAGIDAAVRGGGSIPTLSYISEEYDRGGVRCGTTIKTVGGFHGNFVDAALWAPPWVMRPLSSVIPAAGPCDPAAMHAILASTGSAFLRGEDSPASIAAALRRPPPSRLLELRD